MKFKIMFMKAVLRILELIKLLI